VAAPGGPCLIFAGISRRSAKSESAPCRSPPQGVAGGSLSATYNRWSGHSDAAPGADGQQADNMSEPTQEASGRNCKRSPRPELRDEGAADGRRRSRYGERSMTGAVSGRFEPDRPRRVLSRRSCDLGPGRPLPTPWRGPGPSAEGEQALTTDQSVRFSPGVHPVEGRGWRR
jgi:hypothetical protein